MAALLVGTLEILGKSDVLVCVYVYVCVCICVYVYVCVCVHRFTQVTHPLRY
jgi:hypothetical protein